MDLVKATASFAQAALYVYPIPTDLTASAYFYCPDESATPTHENPPYCAFLPFRPTTANASVRTARPDRPICLSACAQDRAWIVSPGCRRVGATRRCNLCRSKSAAAFALADVEFMQDDSPPRASRDHGPLGGNARPTLMSSDSASASPSPRAQIHLMRRWLGERKQEVPDPCPPGNDEDGQHDAR